MLRELSFTQSYWQSNNIIYSLCSGHAATYTSQEQLNETNRSTRIGNITPVLADGDPRLSKDERFIWHAPFAALKCHIQELYLQEARQQEKEQLFNKKKNKSKIKKLL